ncbi:MAG TPA: hypothetical protein VIU13_06820 [Chryseolinea sp.]
MKTIVLFLMSLFAINSSRCQVFTPVLNDAFMVPHGGVQVTAGYSAMGIAFDGEREGYYNSLDFQLSYGVSPKVNLLARYQKSFYAKQMFEETASNFLFVGPEFRLKENRISLYVPFGAWFVKDGDDYFEITPTVNFSLPLGPIVSFNPAIKLGFVFCEDCAPFLGINLGLGVRPVKSLTFLAEYGLTYSTEEFDGGHFYSINAGIAYLISSGKKSN